MHALLRSGRVLNMKTDNFLPVSKLAVTDTPRFKIFKFLSIRIFDSSFGDKPPTLQKKRRKRDSISIIDNYNNLNSMLMGENMYQFRLATTSILQSLSANDEPFSDVISRTSNLHSSSKSRIC